MTELGRCVSGLAGAFGYHQLVFKEEDITFVTTAIVAIVTFPYHKWVLEDLSQML